eukprot:augustus_masked-scaffold_5-processed-gene-15.46-mRNA-1 protein AED:1.00 eAED:1.00 QI:0/0/0/0/1/1/2/0/195
MIEELTQLITIANSPQNRAILVYTQISICEVARISGNQDGSFEVRVTESRLALSMNLSKHLFLEHVWACSTVALYCAWDGVLDDGIGEELKSLNIYHVKGDDNVFDGRLSHWVGKSKRDQQHVVAARNIRPALCRDGEVADVSTEPQVSLTFNEKRYFRKMSKHPSEVKERLDRWSTLKERYFDSSTSDFDSYDS